MGCWPEYLVTSVQSINPLQTGLWMHCLWLCHTSYLEMLDPIHNRTFHLCHGAFRTSPSSSMSVMANESPLQLRRQKLTLQYCVKLTSNPCSLDYSCVFKPQFKVQFAKKPNRIATHYLSDALRYWSYQKGHCH